LFLQGFISHRQLCAGIRYAILKHKAYQSMGLSSHLSSIAGRWAMPFLKQQFVEGPYEHHNIEVCWRQVVSLLSDQSYGGKTLASVLDDVLFVPNLNMKNLPQVRRALERLSGARAY
jgi:hypothetical protein